MAQHNLFDLASLLLHAKLRLVGASDWSSEEISVYLNHSGEMISSSGELLVPKHVKDAVADHVITLCRHLFFSSKPPKPTQSRWTGVAGVARWALRLSLFHHCLGPVMTALSSGVEQADQAGQEMAPEALDNDVRNSSMALLLNSSLHHAEL